MKPILIILAIPLCLFIFVSAMYFSGVSKGLNYPMEANPVEAVPPSTDTIHDAARRGNIEAMKQHLAAGADVNVKSDFRKYTPLHEAIVGRKLEVANFLIEKGANVNMMDDTFGTPLDIAIMYGAMTEIVDLLRKHGGKTSEKLKAEGK